MTITQNSVRHSTFRTQDRVALVALNHPRDNIGSATFRRQLCEGLEAALKDPMIEAIVIASGEFSDDQFAPESDTYAMSEPATSALFTKIEACAKPVVAAMHGSALGVFLELALACHARVAHAQTEIGLPEVLLGLVPASGGTQRLPRLVGVEQALNLIVSGHRFRAAAMATSGLFDAITNEHPLETALSLARDLAGKVAAGGALRRVGDLRVQMDNAQAFLAFARATVKAGSPRLPAPQACVDCIEYAVTQPLNEGLAKEQETYDRLCRTPESAALRHIASAERKTHEVRGLDVHIPARPIDRTVVVGGGTMGTGIALTLMTAGFPVTLIEREQQALDRALLSVRQNCEMNLKKGRLTPDQFTHCMGLVSGALDYEPVRHASLVIEAVFEDIHVKRQVFEQLDLLAPEGAILATNTSMLNVDVIAQFTHRPQDVLGLHFFSPAHVMRLLEIVRGKETSSQALSTALAFADRVGKTAVVSGVCEGFIGNRILQPYLTQAGLLLDEGALPQQVDQAIERWGMAMGPFRMCDLAGNDVGAKIRERQLELDPEFVYSRTFDAIFQMGRYGQKAGRGWYDYVPGQRKPVNSKEVSDAVIAESQRLKLHRRNISDEEIVDRLLLALVNEGAKVVEEGIAQRTSDVDVVYVTGYGFPRWRGGPMFAAEQRGWANVLRTLRSFSDGPAYQRPNERWQPAALLTRLAQGKLS